MRCLECAESRILALATMHQTSKSDHLRRSSSINPFQEIESQSLDHQSVCCGQYSPAYFISGLLVRQTGEHRAHLSENGNKKCPQSREYGLLLRVYSCKNSNATFEEMSRFCSSISSEISEKCNLFLMRK